ncbi:SNARE protein [Babesia ovis]|uniref:SNARE protein n=1 Tax=Babesia ovis TaxID=5869 RepID=A0A9W5TA39_BABOV|nr:SNARE protein [Babesia ovis]
MDNIWELDVRNALSLIQAANDCMTQFKRKTEENDRQTYGTIVRAKIDSLRKTISNLELTLRDMANSSMSEGELLPKKRQYEDIKRSHQLLEEQLKRPGPDISFNTSHLYQRDLEQMSPSHLYDYRQSVMHAQEDELQMLDKAAGAMHSISTNIRDEIDYHSGLLGDLESAMDSTQTQIMSNRARFEQLINRSSKRRLMFYIIVLTVILVLILIL